MQKTQIIFLRHADTQKNPSINAALWNLSKGGKKQAEIIFSVDIMKDIDFIYTSEEQKTILTAQPIADKLNKKINSLDFFDEVKRGDKFLSKDEFEKEKERQLKDLNYPAFDGETGTKALMRFKNGVKKVVNENLGKKILIVTHGTILNIYFASILKKEKNLLERWNKTVFCAYGIIEITEGKEKVLKDII